MQASTSSGAAPGTELAKQAAAATRQHRGIQSPPGLSMARPVIGITQA
jgi:hypothetical protein